jgi:hypothetical protein
MATACRDIVANQRWTFLQCPWHCARFLLGEIDAAAFLAQPVGASMHDELAFCTGVRAELAGDRDAARGAYREFLAIPRHRRGLVHEPVAERFVRWRLDELAR